MRREHLAAVGRMLSDGMSRRTVVRGVLGALAGLTRARMIGTTAAERVKPTEHTPPNETPSEACYRHCVSEPASPLTQAREQACWTGCDLWAGDDEPV